MERGSMTVVIIYIVGVIAGFTALIATSTSDKFTVYILPLLALAAVIGTVLVYWAVNSTHRQLEKKLKTMTELILHEPGDVLKDLYMDIYNLYMRLSERHQPKYYQKVISIRKTLETQMQAERKIFTLLQESETKSLSELISLYKELYAAFQQLPQKVQGKYYTNIVLLRQKMENGKP